MHQKNFQHTIKFIVADSSEKMEQRSGEEVRRILHHREKVNYFGGEDIEDEIDAAEKDGSCSSEASVSDIEFEEADEDVNEQQNAPTRRRKYAHAKPNISSAFRLRK
ncbi:unnamed protein product [Hermetia illucens]|uniref:Uncharacterized protein n=1 Tax=Hermetia illucens TaxID=343691 RepID=A0A7R8YZC4_HERIL|nr:unnamed protein product [Hermetia illucens]